MNNFLLIQGFSKHQPSKKNKGSEANSALVMPAVFSPDRILANVPRVMVIEAQSSSSNSTPSSSPFQESSPDNAVINPVDLSIESHQVSIILSDQ